MWQVIADQQVAVVVRYRGIARVDAGTDLGHHLQAVHVELADPAVAGVKIDVSPGG